MLTPQCKHRRTGGPVERGSRQGGGMCATAAAAEQAAWTLTVSFPRDVIFYIYSLTPGSFCRSAAPPDQLVVKCLAQRRPGSRCWGIAEGDWITRLLFFKSDCSRMHYFWQGWQKYTHRTDTGVKNFFIQVKVKSFPLKDISLCHFFTRPTEPPVILI